jgi:hypothetical protein
VRNEEVLHSVKEDGNRNNKRKEGEMDGQISRMNCLLRQVTGGLTEGRSEWKTRKKTSASMNGIGK